MASLNSPPKDRTYDEQLSQIQSLSLTSFAIFSLDFRLREYKGNL